MSKMNNLKDVAKHGWHPKGDKGVRETVNNWRGKGSNSNQHTEDHRSAPLSTLKDPSSFGAPPKRHTYGSDQDSPSSASPSSATHAPPAPAAYTRSGLGAPMASSHIQQQQAREQQEEAEASKPAPPPVPYRSDTSGLATDHLPKPPVRRAAPPEPDATASPTPSVKTKPVPANTTKPAPPPRPALPPRQNSHPDEHAPPPPPSYGDATTPEPTERDGYLNKDSVDRLGKAGVNVSGFGIGGRTSSPERAGQGQPTAPQSNSQMNELQQRFARMSRKDESASPSSPIPQTQGTSLQQKQKALQTASDFHKNPSSVSMSDARDAASTANNFRQKHGDQMASGLQKINGLNQKYGTSQPSVAAGGTSASASAAAAEKKAPPPPPPPKKKELIGESLHSNASGHQDEAPPIPLASKPR